MTDRHDNESEASGNAIYSDGWWKIHGPAVREMERQGRKLLEADQRRAAVYAEAYGVAYRQYDGHSETARHAGAHCAGLLAVELAVDRVGPGASPAPDKALRSAFREGFFAGRKSSPMGLTVTEVVALHWNASRTLAALRAPREEAPE